MKDSFIKIEEEYLKSIYTNHYYTPDVYFHSNYFVRWIFWKRLEIIYSMISNLKNKNLDLCLDFGGGSGIFLPTLSKLFKKVVLIDLEPSQSILIKERYNLDNCEIIKKNIFDYTDESFDFIIAADVLEHFMETKKIIYSLNLILKKNGFLATSLPTESFFYQILRKIFNEKKPKDHYFNSSEVEKVLYQNNLKCIKSKSLPLNIPFNLFSIKLWQK